MYTYMCIYITYIIIYVRLCGYNFIPYETLEAMEVCFIFVYRYRYTFGTHIFIYRHRYIDYDKFIYPCIALPIQLHPL